MYFHSNFSSIPISVRNSYNLVTENIFRKLAKKQCFSDLDFGEIEVMRCKISGGSGIKRKVFELSCGYQDTKLQKDVPGIRGYP